MYVTVAEVKSYLRIDDAVDDVFIAAWAATVSRNVDDHCGRQFGQTAGLEPREYPTFYDRHLRRYVANIDDVQDVTGLTVLDKFGTAVAGFRLGPVNNASRGRPFETITAERGGPWTVTARWGWTAVPDAVRTGCFLQAGRLAARRDSPFGIAGSPREGSELRLLAQLDPDFRTSLKPLVRDWWAA
jgi:hypothetical protein